MKRPALFFLLILTITIILPACHESEWADWKLKNEQWLENNKNQSGIVTTASGLQYKVIYPGWKYNRQPNPGSWITATYSGHLIDGSVFDSGTYNSRLSNTIPGWQEALPKVHDGASLMIYVPSKLGYDTLSSNVKVPPHSTLIFEVDLQSSVD